MEIKRVSDESYESISAYLDLILTMTTNLKDLCFVNHDGKKIMITQFGTMTALVENDNGKLTSYFLGKTPSQVDCFSSEDYLYEMREEEDGIEVKRNDLGTKDIYRLSYLYPIENHPRYIVEYLHYIDKLASSVDYSYDVTSRGSLESSLLFCDHHYPDKIVVNVLKQYFIKAYKRKYTYALGLNDEKYHQPRIEIGPLLLGHKRLLLDAGGFIEALGNKGFISKIPEDLSSLLRGDNETYNRLKLVSNEYRNFINKESK